MLQPHPSVFQSSRQISRKVSTAAISMNLSRCQKTAVPIPPSGNSITDQRIPLTTKPCGAVCWPSRAFLRPSAHPASSSLCLKAGYPFDPLYRNDPYPKAEHIPSCAPCPALLLNVSSHETYQREWLPRGRSSWSTSQRPSTCPLRPTGSFSPSYLQAIGKTDPYSLRIDPSLHTKWVVPVPNHSLQSDTDAPSVTQFRHSRSPQDPLRDSAAAAPPCTPCPVPSPYPNPTSIPSPHPSRSSPGTSVQRISQTASCKRDCSQANSASLASLSHTLGIEPAAPPPPDRSEHPHRTGPVSNAPSCRNNSNKSFRNSHISVFLCPLKLDYPRPGISKYPSNLGSWTISGESILVQQSPSLFHLIIMQGFFFNRKYLLSLFHAILNVFGGIILPTHFPEDPL